MLNQSTEQEQIILAQQGDNEAFSELVELYQRPVYNLCYRMLGMAEEAEDAAQETFFRAYRAIRKYDNQRSFITWLLAIAAHYCVDQIRKRRMNFVSIEELPVPDIPDNSLGVEKQISQQQEKQRVRALLQVLDPTDRAAVIMYYWYEFSYKEICQALNLSESAVKSRLHRARRVMSQSWVDQENVSPMALERIPV